MSSIIAKAQRLMNSKGLNVGLDDGIWGPRTESGWQRLYPTLGEPWGHLSAEFKAKTADIAQGLRMPPEGRDWLLACMSFETGGSFSPSVVNGAGSGACVTTNVLPITRRCGVVEVADLLDDDEILAVDRDTGRVYFTPLLAINQHDATHLYVHSVNHANGFASTYDHNWWVDDQEYTSETLPSCVLLPNPGPYYGGELPGVAIDSTLMQIMLILCLFGETLADGSARIRITDKNSKQLMDYIDTALYLSGGLSHAKVESGFVDYYILSDYVEHYRDLTTGVVCREAANIMANQLSRMLLDTHTTVLYDVAKSAHSDLAVIQLFGDVRIRVQAAGANALTIMPVVYTDNTLDELNTAALEGESEVESVWCPTVESGLWVGMVNGVQPIVTGNSGLIQFMPATARGLGTTTAALRAMTDMEQLDYVELYFRHNRGRLKNLGDVYMAILWPAGIGKPDTYTLWDRETRPTTYRQNAGLDRNKDGSITRRECLVHIREHLLAGFGIR